MPGPEHDGHHSVRHDPHIGRGDAGSDAGAIDRLLYAGRSPDAGSLIDEHRGLTHGALVASQNSIEADLLGYLCFDAREGAPDGTVFHPAETPLATIETFRAITDDLVEMKPETVRLIEATMEAIEQYLLAINQGKEIIKPKDLVYLRQFLLELITERDVRADEVESPEVAEAGEIANELFDVPPYAFLCIDGRINLTLLFGIVARIKGGSIQLPAGNPIEFVRTEAGKSMLDPNSNAARQIDQALQGQHEIMEILDSHLACAAWEEHERVVGHSLNDHGLREDVKHKLKMARAIQTYIEQYHPGKTIDSIQVSFDPRNGYMFMGLERDEALDASREEGVYTAEKLSQLSQEDKILSTEMLAQDPAIGAIFDAAFKQFNPRHDWKLRYKETAVQFWRAIQGMQTTVMPILEERLIKLYPHLAGKPSLKRRALLLLTNAFNGYCHNKNQAYPFAEHEEVFVSVTSRDFRPCPKMGFSVDSADLENMSSGVVFANGIVRKVRKGLPDGEVPDPYQSKSEYLPAPVAVVVKEIVRTEYSPQQWAEVRKIDWTFLRDINWKKLTDREFTGLIRANNPQLNIDIGIGSALNYLRSKMAAIYDRRGPAAELLMKGNLFAIPVLADSSRRLRVVVPFCLKGFDRLLPAKERLAA